MRVSIRLLTSATIIASLSGCGIPPKTADPKLSFKTSTGRDNSAAKYVIDPPDEIQIKSPTIKEIDGQNQRVRADGTISVNLLGDLKVQGLTPSQVEALLTERTSRFYISPNIHVDVIANSKFYLVVGASGSSRKYVYTGNNSVGQALMNDEATADAWPTTILLIRPNPSHDGPIRIVVDLQHMCETSDITQNYVLEEGDIIALPKGPFTLGFRRNPFGPTLAPDIVRPGLNPLLPLR